MAYKTIINRLLSGEFPNSENLPTELDRCRRILANGNRYSYTASTDLKELVRVTYETSFAAYLKTFVEDDVQFEDTTETRGITSTFNLQALYQELLFREGWLEEEFVADVSEYVHWEIIRPMRERISEFESPQEVVGLAVVLYCLAANQIRLGGRQLVL